MQVASSLTEQAVVLERGRMVLARIRGLLNDHKTLDRYIGLKVAAFVRR